MRTMMSTVQDIAFAFAYSAKRLVAFSAELATDGNTKEQLDQRTKLRTLCETRWSSRADALFTFKAAYPVVVHALEALQEDGDDKAGQHVNAIMRFDFVIALVTAQHVLSGTVALTNFLQKVECDLLEAVQEAKIVVRRLNDERNDDTVWETLYDSAVKIASEFEIEPSVPRRVGKQQHRANYPVDSPSDYWRVALYYPFSGHLVEEIDMRLLKNEERYSAEVLLPNKVASLSDTAAGEIYDTFSADLTQDREVFTDEVSRWKTRWSMANEKPTRIMDALNATHKDLYPNIYMILAILVTMPPSSATAERSFSAMRRIKNFLRATMGDSRLSALA